MKEFKTIPPPENKKNFILCLIIGSFIWSFIILGGVMCFIQLGFSDNFIPDHICNVRIENVTNISFQWGYNQGVYDTSQRVIINDTMVIFQSNGTHIFFNDMNMSLYYSDKLNLIGGNK